MPLELKGSSFTLSVIHLHATEPEAIRQALEEKIQQAPDFLKHAPVVINVSALSGKFSWKAIQQVIQQAGLRIVGVSGCPDGPVRNAVLRSGIPVLTEGKTPRKPRATSPTPEPAPPEPPPADRARIITAPVRSGQRIYARNSDLIVLANVSAGAELLADGNIHVYGMMRGRALAGAGGDKTSQIFCLNLQAELVSVAGEYWLSEQIPSEFHGQAARLALCDNALTIQTLIKDR